MSGYGDEYGLLYGGYSSVRSSSLQVAVMDWLEADDVVGYYLGSDGDVVPVAIAAESKADPRLSVGVSESGSGRQNRREEKTFEVRVIVDGTKQYVQEDGSVLDLMRLKSRVADVLTTHRDGWGADGVIADEEVAWNDDVNRYLGVLSVGYERDDLADAHN